MPANIVWKDIESLLSALGREIKEGIVSRVRLALNGVRAVFHRPRPDPKTDRGAAKSMRRFIVTICLVNCHRKIHQIQLGAYTFTAEHHEL